MPRTQCIKEDLLGRRFGSLTVVGEAPHIGTKVAWECLCDCGSLRTVKAMSLKSGTVFSCGCHRLSRPAYVPTDDITGNTYGLLTVVQPITSGELAGKWECRCTCGRVTRVLAAHLKNGHTRSCGDSRCISSFKKPSTSSRRGIPTKVPSRKNLTGKVFGRLTVIEFVEVDSFRRAVWQCLCICGNVCQVNSAYLRTGKEPSCGCYKLQRQREVIEENRDKYNWRGENHPVYKEHKKENVRVKQRNLLGYKIWRMAVYERDKYTCQLCAQIGGQLHAHHMNSYEEYSQQRMDVTNGVTLCTACHRAFHKQYGTRITHEWQFNEFKNLYLANNLLTN